MVWFSDLWAEFCGTVWASGGLWPLFDQGLRTVVCLSFLAPGGALLWLKTFIVVKMKEGVYDTPRYQRMLDDAETLTGKRPERYRPLWRLRELLFWSAISCFITSMMPYTVGRTGGTIAALACIGAPIASLCLVVWCLFVIRQNLHDLFDFAERERRYGAAGSRKSEG